MPKDRARRRTYGPKDLVQEQPCPTVPPESVWAGLTETERRFVLGYLEHGDVRRAFIDSGQEHGQRYVRQCAFHVLRRPRIQAAVARAQAFFAEQVGLHAWQILGALHAQAFHDPADVYEEDDEGGWTLRPMSEWPLPSRLAVQKIRVEESPTETGVRRKTEIEFADRQHALFLLGKHMKLYEKNNRETVPFTLIVNSGPEAIGPKQVGPEVIEGINLRIQMPESER